MRRFLVLACAALTVGVQAQAASIDDWCPPPGRMQTVFADDFSAGLAAWRVEAQDARSTWNYVTHAATLQGRSGLDVQTPAGISLWLLRELQGDYAVRFTAIALPAPDSAGALARRVSDLNLFWNASEADGSAPRVRDGAFASYDSLRTFYLGLGANGNRTTRLRLYDGRGQREVLDGWADAQEASAADRQGPMTDSTRLQAGRPVAVQIVSRQPTQEDATHLQVWANGRQLFKRAAPQVPANLLRGHFALRTTASRFLFTDFKVLQCTKDTR